MFNIIRKIATSSVLFVFSIGLVIAGGTAPATHKVGMADWLFKPAELTIQAGDTVTWLNDDDTLHNVAFYEVKPANAPTREKPQKVRKRKEFSLAFDQAGVFKYVCTIHEEFDMKGVITVK